MISRAADWPVRRPASTQASCCLFHSSHESTATCSGPSQLALRRHCKPDAIRWCARSASECSNRNGPSPACATYVGRLSMHYGFVSSECGPLSVVGKLDSSMSAPLSLQVTPTVVVRNLGQAFEDLQSERAPTSRIAVFGRLLHQPPLGFPKVVSHLGAGEWRTVTGLATRPCRNRSSACWQHGSNERSELSCVLKAMVAEGDHVPFPILWRRVVQRVQIMDEQRVRRQVLLQIPGQGGRRRLIAPWIRANSSSSAGRGSTRNRTGAEWWNRRCPRAPVGRGHGENSLVGVCKAVALELEQ